MVKRILNHFQLRFSGRTVAIFGGGQEDFILSNLKKLGIPQLLWIWLHRENYERILYYDPTNGLYAYDTTSLEIETYIQPVENENNLTGWEDSGEWKLDKTINPDSPRPAVVYTYNNNMYKTGLYGQAALEVLSILVETGNKIAIIFPLFDQIFINDTAIRNLFNTKIGDWANNFKYDNLKIFFNFSFDTQDQCFDFINHYEFTALSDMFESRQMGSIQTFRFKNNRYIKIGRPKSDEIGHLLHKNRLIESKSIEWENGHNIIRGLASNDISLRNLQLLIEDYNTINVSSLNQGLIRYFETSTKKKIPMISDKKSSGIEQLNSLIGISKVKETIEEFIAVAKFGTESGGVKYHMAFVGETGTGKTEVAKIVAKIFAEDEIIKECGFTYVTPQSLISGYVGQTAIKTSEVCNEAKPGVLLIDEAYGIAKSDFGEECIAELLTHMTESRGDLCIILAGYGNEMNDLFNINEGLKNRISNENIITFSNYSVDELMQIFDLMISKTSIELVDEVRDYIKKYVAYSLQKNSKEFGNARGIENIIEILKRTKALKLAKNQNPIISLNDVELKLSFPKSFSIKGNSKNTQSGLEELRALIGLAKVKETIEDFIAVARLDEEEIKYHLAFLGSTGTGKTEVAKIVAKIFNEEQIIKNSKYKYVKAKDLIAGYVGQTAIKTAKVCNDAKPGVLFIDEAYNLTSGSSSNGVDFGAECIGELLTHMTENKGELCVIFAGYGNVMQDLFNVNEGLKNRISRDNIIEFPDYTVDELMQIFDLKLSAKSFELGERVKEYIKKYVEYSMQRDSKEFGNARGIENIIETLTKIKARKKQNQQNTIILLEDVKIRLVIENNTEFENTNIELTIEESYPANFSLPESLDNAVGLIKAGDGTGTGFIISKYGHLITCYHVIAKAKEIQFKTDKMNSFVNAELCFCDSDKDFAILKLTQIPAGLSYCSLMDSDENMPVLTQLINKSYPLGTDINPNITTYTGEINGERDISGFHAFQTNLNVTHGSSGGPVFRKQDYKVVGYVTAGLHSERTRGASFVFVWDIRQIYQYESLNIFISKNDSQVLTSIEQNNSQNMQKTIVLSEDSITYDSIPKSPESKKTPILNYDIQVSQIDEKTLIEDKEAKKYFPYDFVIIDTNIWIANNVSNIPILRTILKTCEKEDVKVKITSFTFEEIEKKEREFRRNEKKEQGNQTNQKKDLPSHSELIKRAKILIKDFQAKDVLIVDPMQNGILKSEIYADPQIIQVAEQLLLENKKVLVVTNDTGEIIKIRSNLKQHPKEMWKVIDKNELQKISLNIKNDQNNGKLS